MDTDETQGSLGRTVSKNEISSDAGEVQEARLPDFLGIGAQKAGTSWLYSNLRMHPGIFIPALKELHYFDRDFNQPLSFYQAYFTSAGDKIAGEITPAYGILADERIESIKCLMPKLKLILILRNPVERAWSHALMDLVVREGRSYASLTEDDFTRHFRGKVSLARGDYDRILERWLRHYPLQQMLVAYYEDIGKQPEEFLRRVFVHLGVSIPSDWSGFPYHEVVHRGPGIQIPDAYAMQLREIYHEPVQRLSQRLQSLGLPPAGY